MAIKSKATLTSETSSTLADNVVQDITPEDVRTTCETIVENCHPEFLVNTQTDDYTPILTDSNLTYIRMDKATNIVLTLPINSAVSFPVGTKLNVSQTGVGSLTIAPASGVTLTTPSDRNGILRGQGCSVTLIKVATNIWEVLAGSSDLQNPNGETLLMD